jgi:hypothetical protein
LNEKYAMVRDGALGAHIGYAPVFKRGDDLDLEGRREKNVKYEGAGETGKILLDYQWNGMMAGKGMRERGLPMYDKRLWDDANAPTVRSVTDIALSIVGTVAGGPLGVVIGLADDLLFAGIDVSGGVQDGGGSREGAGDNDGDECGNSGSRGDREIDREDGGSNDEGGDSGGDGVCERGNGGGDRGDGL